MSNVKEKYRALLDYLKEPGSAVIAYSGGVDSTFLLMAAKEALGENIAAVTVKSCFFPEREFREAADFCSQQGIRQIVVEQTLDIPGFTDNPPDRCYHCKKALFQKIVKIAREEGMAYVAEGSNMDDLEDYRPGHRAIKELGIVSPLRHAGLTKEEIRELSHRKELPTWNKPSYACLASRFPYGESINKDKLAMVEKSEQLLMDLGFYQFRVRIHGNIARIEVLPEELHMLLDKREDIVQKLKEYGFSYVTMDLQGYRTGSMNEVIDTKETNVHIK